MNYTIEQAKKQIKTMVEKVVGKKIDINSVKTPPVNIKADLTLPVFKFVNSKKTNPNKLAQKICDKINLSNTLFNQTFAQGGFVNFIFDYGKYTKKVISNFQKMGHSYGEANIGKGKLILIDFSSPNIAKPFSIGHLRSTIIGQALCNIYQFLDYKVIGDNHIGDWGTQFGKLITAYKMWGDRSKIERKSIKELFNLYVKFHREAKKEPILNEEAREWFRKLEQGNREALNIWKWMRKISLDEFVEIYDLLGINFDQILGESFYRDKTDEIVKKFEKMKIARWEIALDNKGKPVKNNEKVLLIDLKKHNIKTPILLKKSDGATLYATRDLAAAKYRIEKWNPEKILYVVGADQELYFQQIFQAIKLLGFKVDAKHIKFGLIRLVEGKMSTREGRVIFLEDVLNEVVKRVKKILVDRNLSNYKKEQIAKIIGIGAVKYADLSQNRIKNIVFNWNKVLSLKGNSGPYLQYQCVRINSILAKANFNKNIRIKSELLNSAEEKMLIKSISKFNSVLVNISESCDIHNLASYLYCLANNFSSFYEKHSVLRAENQNLKKSRLYLCYMTFQVLKSGLNLLGIDVPEKM